MKTNTTSTLNNLIETLKDGQEGFRSAAEDVSHPELKTLFHQYSLQRAQFVGELQELAREYGEHDPADSGSTLGALHRGWINLKAALASKDEHAVLAECERGEDSALAAYNKALEDPELPAHVADRLRSQHVEIKTTHDHVRNLRDAAAAMKKSS